jgi:hypothetical protein
VSKVNARLQQFFDSNTNHSFPFVIRPPRSRQAIPRNSGLVLVVVAATGIRLEYRSLTAITLQYPIQGPKETQAYLGAPAGAIPIFGPIDSPAQAVEPDVS